MHNYSLDFALSNVKTAGSFPVSIANVDGNFEPIATGPVNYFFKRFFARCKAVAIVTVLKDEAFKIAKAVVNNLGNLACEGLLIRSSWALFYRFAASR